MGVHWYAESQELLDHERRAADVERRIMAPEVDVRDLDNALVARETLLVQEDELRAELKHRGAAVTFESARAWPKSVRAHIDALGPARLDESVLARLGWGTDYYIENLRSARVPMDSFSHRLDYLRVSPAEARALSEELLHFAATTQLAGAVRHTREAGLWLYLWGSLDCSVEASQ